MDQRKPRAPVVTFAPDTFEVPSSGGITRKPTARKKKTAVAPGNSGNGEGQKELSTEECKKHLENLHRELEMARNGDHPRLIEQRERGRIISERESERIDIEYERGMERIQRDHEDRLNESRRLLEIKLRENKEQNKIRTQALLREIDDEVALVAAETEALDISGPAAPCFAMNKRNLRRRGAVDPVVIFQEAPRAKKAKVVQPAIKYLLTDQQIAEDLELINAPNKEKYRVSMENGKLMFDGKLYPKMVPLLIRTHSYPVPFSVLMWTIADKMCTFRANKPGDTRIVTCTFMDLKCGVVEVLKFDK